MNSDQSAAFSDLERARALSRKLAGTVSISPRSGPMSAGEYVQLERKTGGIPRWRFGEAAGRPGGEGYLSGWDARLEHILQACRARCVFVVDYHGLVVASRGELASEEIARIGSRLVIALDQAVRLGVGSRHRPAVGLEVGPLWLTGFPFESGADLLVFGILRAEMPNEAERAETERLLQR